MTSIHAAGRARTVLTATLVAIAAAALYLPDLAGSPFYLNRDEMFFGLTAHSLVTTGYDANGNYLPLYTQSPMRYGSEMWFQPALMYTAALSVKLFTLTEGTIRLPMTLFAIVDIVLIYLVGQKLFRRESLALGCAALLAVAPAHYIHSRVAMDFQAPLPFLLMWLLSILHYFERGRTAWLVAAGASLGLGVFTYIAAYMWMPIYAGLTMLAMWQRRERGRQMAVFAIACLVPVLACVPFLISHPTVIRDVMWHYDREQSQAAGGGELFVRYFDFERFLKAAVVYWKFLNPRFLFVDGPGGLWTGGAFLFPTAGLLLVGLPAVLRRTRTESVLLVGGLLTAAIPASLAGDTDAIHRASAVLPFGVLIAMYALDSIKNARLATAMFVTIWVALIWLASEQRGELPRAQAAIRACTVPLAFAALYLLTSWRAVLGRHLRFWLAAAVAVAGWQIVYWALDFPAAAWLSFAGAALIAIIAVRHEGSEPMKDMLAGAVLGTAASLFVFTHGDYSSFGRIGPIPATAIVMLARTVTALVALAMFLAVLRTAQRLVTRWSELSAMAGMAVAVIALQVAYFYIDYSTQPLPRTLHALLLFGSTAAAVAILTRAGSWTVVLRWLGAAAMGGLIAMQFAAFRADYFTRYRAEAGQFDTEGNARIVMEAVIDHARQREVPAIYFGSVGPYGFADLYWRFYAIKHGREDLLARSTADLSLSVDRIRSLPAGSLVVTSPAPDIDAAIERLRNEKLLRTAQLLTAPQPRSKFWLLETGPPD